MSYTKILRLAVVSSMLLAPLAANADSDKPAGAVKGAAVGGLAGHEVGKGHAVAGAAAGAAIGHHQRKKAEQKMDR